MAVIYTSDENAGVVFMDVYGWRSRIDKTPIYKCTALIDLDDLSEVEKAGAWHAIKDPRLKRDYWQVRKANGLYLSRYLLKLNSNSTVKIRHIDNNPLNYRRSNLKMI